jgi:hypothetical protein
VSGTTVPPAASVEPGRRVIWTHVAATAFRWVLGVLLVVLTGWAYAAVLAALVLEGPQLRVALLGVAAAWVSLGAIGFVLRREVGRQILVGTMEAIVFVAVALAAKALWRPDPLLGVFGRTGPPAVLGGIAGLLLIGLRVRATRAGMRPALPQGRRTTR